MNRIVTVFLLIVSFFLLFSCKDKPTETPPLETKISGKVFDKETNNVLVGATVTTNPATSSVTTDNSGTYTIPDVKAGQYVVSATKDGYKSASISVVVTEGKTSSADIQLSPLAPELSVSATSLSFGTSSTSLTFTITNTGVGTLTWSILSSASWITVNPTSGSTEKESDVVTVTINRSGLNFGNYYETITVASNTNSKTIDIIMTVPNPNAPQLSVYPFSLDFESSKTEMTFYISNSGAGALTWNITGDKSWITYLPNSGTTTTEIEEVKVTVDRSGLSAGVHTGNILVSSFGGNQTISVSLVVPDTPSILISPQTLDFGGSKNTMTFDIANAGTGNLNWSLTDNQVWITANPTSGTNFGTINVTVNRSGLSNGSYSGQITITSNSGNGNVIVQMKKSPPNSPPTASFIVEPATGELSTFFTVDASGSSDDNTTISNLQVRWKWETGSDFSDWTTSKTTTHQYTTTGSKTITLEVKDEEGATGSADKTVNVVEQFKPPIACFTVSPMAGSPITEITLDASCSKDPNNPVQSLQYRWDYESDGTWDEIFSTATTVKHKFSQKNSTVTITLEAKNTIGLSTTTTKEIKIGDFEGFENGIPTSWSTGGDSFWGLSTEAKHSGSYSAKAGDMTAVNQTSWIQKTGTGPFTVRFLAYGGNGAYDYQFEFYIDSTRYVYIPYGSYFSWNEYIFQTTSGEHTLKWICTYDGSGSGKKIYLDDVEFIPTTE